MLPMAGKKVKCSDLKSRDDQTESVQTQRFPILSCEKKIENTFFDIWN